MTTIPQLSDIFRRSFIAIGFVASLLAAIPAEAAWVPLPSLSHSPANLDLPVHLDEAGRLTLRISSETGTRMILHLGRENSTVEFDPANAPDKQFTGRIVGRPFENPPGDAPLRLLLKRRSRGWTFYLDNVPLVEMPEGFTGPLHLEIPESHLPDPDAPDVFIQRVAPYVFLDDFLVPEGTEYPLMQWEKRIGDWQLHSVTQQLAGTKGARGKPGRNSPGADRSPNFYSLSGYGTNAVITTGMDFLDHYRVSAAVQHNSGTNGIVFLVRPETGEFHALTLENTPGKPTLVLALWKGRSGSARREFLAAAETELIPGQWFLLQASLFDDLVVCSINRSEVLRERLALPPGGQFGLFANSPDGTRFDDVAVKTHDDLVISTPRDIARHLRFSPDQVRIEEGALDKNSGSRIRRQKNHFRVLRGAPARIMVGGLSSSPRNIEALFHANRKPPGPYAVSLGTNGQHEALFSLTCIPEENVKRVRLLQNGKTVLDEFSVPTKTDSPHTSLRLEAQENGRLFGSVDGRLAVQSAAGSAPVGPAEVSAFPDTRLSLPVRSTPELDLKDHRENVQNFVIDPFMRHWASPEGQWVPDPDGLVWYRGDVFGAVEITLPLPANSELHMAVVDGGTHGAIILRTEAAENLRIEIHPDPTDEDSTRTTVIPLSDIPMQELDGVGKLPLATLHLRDHCFWIRAGDKDLFSTHLDSSLPGSRMRVQGYSTEALRFVQVVRDNVLDVLFKTSLFDWTLNGGRWEIINRFHCDPRWSHMNGENADGLAALWSHFEFHGDFCAELFAGTRHGWYSRVGDFNMTLLNNTNFAGSGYSVITTGWDPDESALYSRLLRNGRELSSSTEYAAPRYREGNVRKGREPLVASGRDVHGAWYSIKLRRLGDLLMYSFDNTPLITVRDPHPLLSGGLGIWTYRTSMMVARVRVAAEKITPRAVPARRIDPSILTGSESNGHPFDPAVSGHPLAAPLHPAYWHPEDDVGRPVIDWIKDADNEPLMRVRSSLGAGTFLAKAQLPPLPTEKLSGFRFEIARLPKTAVNFAFSLGTTNNTAFDPAAEYSFVLSGTTQPNGSRRILGSGKIPASETDDLSKASPSSVFVPLPTDAVSIASLARVDGFGNLQPSEIQQGLSANPPGSAYAVRGFLPVWLGIDAAADVLHLGEKDRQRLAEVNSSLAPGAIGSLSVSLPEGAPARVYWQKQPDFDDIAITFSKTLPDTIVFSVPGEHPWRMPPDTLLKINGTELSLQPHELGWKAEIPRPTPWRPGSSLQVQLFTNAIPVLQSMRLPVDAPTNFPPILTRLDYNGHFNAFETLDSGPTEEFGGAAGIRIVRRPPPNGSILRLENRGESSRLHGILGKQIDLLANPLLSIGYRADKLARVSIEPVSKIALNFSEPFTNPEISADPAVLDEQHHIYNARAIPDKGAFPLNVYQALSASTLGLRSRHRIDQTGLYSWMELDRLVCGPAIGPERPLEFQAFFTDLDAVQKCEYRIVPEKGASSPEATPWIVFTNETVIAPDMGNLSNGRYALHLRADDTRGAVSEVVSIPFLYDETPPRLDIAMEEEVPAASNGKRLALLAKKDAHLSALRFDTLSMHCEGRPVPLNPSRKTIELSPGNARISFDWPRMLASFLDDSADGDILRVEFDGVRDGAGNPAAAAQTSIRIDYALDSTPPTAASFRALPNENPHWLRLAIGDYAATAFFGGDRYTQYAHVSDSGDYGALEMTPTHPRSSPTVSFGKKPWKPSQHPWLALSLCATHALVKEEDAAVTLTLHAAGDATFNVNGKNTKSFRLPLIAKPTSSLESRYSESLIGSIDWTTNRWNDLIIDVRKLLDEGGGAPPPIASLSLGFSREKNLRVRIRSLAVMAAWEEGQRLRFAAHDASGMGGIVWAGGETDEMEISPARLPLPEDGTRWLRLRLRDKPGNTTPEIHVPLPPPPPPTGTAGNEENDPKSEGTNKE